MEQISLKTLVTNVRYSTFGAGSVKAIDRVTAAYAKLHKLTDKQTEMVRKELSLFIDAFLDGQVPQPPQNQNTPPQKSN
jgi:hypothetical protein